MPPGAAKPRVRRPLLGAEGLRWVDAGRAPAPRRARGWRSNFAPSHTNSGLTGRGSKPFTAHARARRVTGGRPRPRATASEAARPAPRDPPRHVRYMHPRGPDRRETATSSRRTRRTTCDGERLFVHLLQPVSAPQRRQLARLAERHMASSAWRSPDPRHGFVPEHAKHLHLSAVVPDQRPPPGRPGASPGSSRRSAFARRG